MTDDSLRARLRRLIPPLIARPLRAALGVVRAARRRQLLRHAVAELRREAAAGAVTLETLSRLREAWGNPGYSADVSFLHRVATTALTAAGPLLECGSGITTIVAGTVSGVRGVELHSLEEDAHWMEQVAVLLPLLGLTQVRLIHASLRSYDLFAWYDVDSVELPASFSHVFCDGPVVGARRWPPDVHARWRMGLVPVLQGRGIRFGEILLDDADDPRSAELCRQWEQRGVATMVEASPTGPLIVAHPVGR